MGNFTEKILAKASLLGTAYNIRGIRQDGKCCLICGKNCSPTRAAGEIGKDFLLAKFTHLMITSMLILIPEVLLQKVWRISLQAPSPPPPPPLQS